MRDTEYNNYQKELSLQDNIEKAKDEIIEYETGHSINKERYHKAKSYINSLPEDMQVDCDREIERAVIDYKIKNDINE